jgi:spore germination cell wall hydrolase CwlJ-like protein
MMTITEHDRRIAALTIWAEARSEGETGMAAVAWVILHRAANPRWWGRNGVADVCLFRKGAWGQFSCWNPDDPQRRRMMGWLGGDVGGPLSIEGAMATQAARAVFEAVEAGRIPDPTDGATHYLTHAAARTAAWAVGKAAHRIIGGHRFFRPQDIGEAPIRPWRPTHSPIDAPAIVTPPAPGGFWAALAKALAALFRRKP